MKAIVMRIIVCILRVLFLFFRPLKLQAKVVILSRQSNHQTVDIKLIAEELKLKKIKTVVLTKRIEKTLLGLVKYGVHMLVQMYHIATSKLVIIDGYCILVSILHKKKGQKVIQIWHALGAIKKFGYQTIGHSDGISYDTAYIMRMHRNSDYIIAPSDLTADFFCEGFDVDKSKVLIRGLPRIDYIKAKTLETYTHIVSNYPEIAEKENILYAPTFRKNDVIEINPLLSCFDFDKYNLVIKKHRLDGTNYEKYTRKGLIIDKKFFAMDWLKVCTKVITDYSAITFEAAIADKDVYFYVPDINRYRERTGMNIDYFKESISKYVYEDANLLCIDLKKKYEKGLLRNFKNKYIEVDYEGCTKMLVDDFQRIIFDEEVVDRIIQEESAIS